MFFNYQYGNVFNTNEIRINNKITNNRNKNSVIFKQNVKRETYRAV